MTKPVTYSKRKVFHISRNDLLNLLGIEKLRVELALILSGGNREQAAKILDMNVRTLHRKLNDFDLNSNTEKDGP